MSTINKIVFTSLFLFFHIFVVLSQNRTLTGIIIDKNTLSPIPYSTLEIIGERKGVIANKEGKFNLSLEEKYLEDTLLVSAIGYEPYILTREEKLKNLPFTISLIKKSYRLKEVTVTASKSKTIAVGYKNEKKLFQKSMGIIINIENESEFFLHQQIARFIKNPNQYNGYIKNVQFCIGRNGIKQTPFRVRLYKPDGKNNSPGSDLLNEQLIVTANGKGWLKVDLTKYKIPVPTEGFYVAMEWIYDEKYTYIEKVGGAIIINDKEKKIKEVKLFGQCLWMCEGTEENRAWIKYLGMPWSVINDFFKSPVNAMIKTELEVF